KLVDPRTRKAHMIKKEIPTRNFLDVGKSSSKVAATMGLPEAPLQEMDIPEDPIDLPEAPLPEMDIPEDPIQKDSSDDNSVVSSHEEFYSFISKSQSNKGKRPVRRRRNSQYPIILENLFSDEEENLAEDLLDLEDEELTDQEIDFNSPETLYENIETPIEPIDLNKGFAWMILWVLKYQKRHRKSEVEPNSLMASKALGVCVHMIKYATCEQCCKLYNTADVSTDKPNMVPK
ncbi:9070_t:CDS:2, partial [Gigaspora rosea]